MGNKLRDWYCAALTVAANNHDVGYKRPETSRIGMGTTHGKCIRENHFNEVNIFLLFL